MVWRYLDADGRVAGEGNWVLGQLTCLRQGELSMAVPFSSDTVVTTDETLEGSCLRFTRSLGHRDGWLGWDEGVTSGEFPAGVILPQPMPAARYASAATCPSP
jgi:hypothetical protein